MSYLQITIFYCLFYLFVELEGKRGFCQIQILCHKKFGAERLRTDSKFYQPRNKILNSFLEIWSCLYLYTVHNSAWEKLLAGFLVYKWNIYIVIMSTKNKMQKGDSTVHMSHIILILCEIVLWSEFHAPLLLTWGEWLSKWPGGWNLGYMGKSSGAE